MKIKDFLLPFVFAIAGVWLMNYFFPREKVTADAGGQRVSLPQQQVELKPLNKEIDFVDEPSSKKVEETTIETQYGHLVFTTEAASLQRAEYIRNVDGKSITLTTITPPADVAREQSFFLVALNEKTPYYYTLEKHEENDQFAELTYRARTSNGTIEKTYTVHKDVHKIDLQLTVKPQGEVQPRIFFSSPALSGLAKPEQIAGVMEEGQSTVKYLRSRYVRELTDNFWTRPSLFGAEDRYFINAMVADANNFTQRGYFNLEGEHVYPILEGPSITKETSWKLSFYLGPKEQAAMVTVDPRLESVLDFGWFAPIAKLLLWILLWLNSYVHNFGLAIIILTVLIRLLLVPVSFNTAQQGKKMKDMNKKIQQVKQKYKDDPEVLKREQEEIYKKYGFGSMGAGCLPILLQIPIFIAMNRVLTSSINLYKASFLWIPDLSSSDPYYILPILTGVSLYFVSVSQAQDASQKVSGSIMAVVMGIVTTGFSAGLALYFVISSFAGAAQTFIQKKLNL